jgi:hypothetical protein
MELLYVSKFLYYRIHGLSEDYSHGIVRCVGFELKNLVLNLVSLVVKRGYV